MVGDSEYPSKNGVARGLLGESNFFGEKRPAMDPGGCPAGSHPMKSLLCLVIASLLAGALSVHALPWGPGETVSAARAFSLNGKWYSVGKPVNSDSLLRGELSKRGIDIPRILREPKDRGGVSGEKHPLTIYTKHILLF